MSRQASREQEGLGVVGASIGPDPGVYADISNLDTHYRGRDVLITGGGFLAGHLTHALRTLGARCVVWDRKVLDLTDDDALAAASQRHPRFDYLFHLATVQRTGALTPVVREYVFRANIRLHDSVLALWAHAYPEARFIATGCACSYAEADFPQAEAHMNAGLLHPSVAEYGLTKRLLFAGIEMHVKHSGLHGMMCVLSIMYGPGDHTEEDRTHFITALAKRFVAAVRAGAPAVEVWGDGSQTRDVIFVTDQVKRLLISAALDGPGIHNIGADLGVTVRKVVESIVLATGFTGRVYYDATKYTGVRYKVLDCSQFLGRHRPPPLTPLAVGITKTVAAMYCQRKPL